MNGHGGASRWLGAPATLALVAVMSLAACSTAPPTYTAEPGPFLGPLEPGAIRYICHEFPFDPALLDVPATDEDADTPYAAALRALILPPVEPTLPRAGWHLLGSDADSAEFAAGSAGEGLNLVAVLPWDGRLRAQDYGTCQPQLVFPPGVGIAQWVLDPDDRALEAASTTFRALVTERARASGKAAIGRVFGPTIAYLEDRVVVAFGVRPKPGAATCQGNPPVPIRVDLSQPLGDRFLVDPAMLPIGEFHIPT